MYLQDTENIPGTLEKEYCWVKRLPGEIISDENIMESASGGLALQGIFKTGNDEDMLKNRQQLIQTPMCKILGPQHGLQLRQFEYSSLESQQKHLKIIKNIGFNFPFSRVPSVLIGGDTTTEHSSTDIFLAKCSYIPCASVHINDQQIALSDGALERLKHISASLSVSQTEQNYPLHLLEVAKEFFERFGSHAVHGSLHFGGMYWREASAKLTADHKTDKTGVKGLVSLKLSEFFNPACGIQKTNVIACNEEHANVRFSLEIIGGQPGEDDYEKWKRSLCKKNWAVIDRGSNYIPVWEIIQNNHSKDLCDVPKLCHFLEKAYVDLTKDTESGTAREIKQLRNDAKETIKSVKNWSLIGPNAEKNLHKLLELKNKMRECKLLKDWTEICLSDKNLQTYLLNVTVNYKAEHLKHLMSRIIDTECDTVEDFPNRHQIMQWIAEINESKNRESVDLQPISNFSELNDVLQIAGDTLRKSRESPEVVTGKVAYALRSWCAALRENGHGDLEMLVQFIISAVGFRDATFHPILGLKEVELMQKKICEAYKQHCTLKETSKQAAQAFALLAGLTMSEEDKDSKIFPVHKKLNYARNFARQIEEICPEVQMAIEEFTKECNLGIIENELRSVIRRYTGRDDKTEESHMYAYCILQDVKREEKDFSIEDETDDIHEESSKKFQELLIDLDLQEKRKISREDFIAIKRLALNTCQSTEESALWSQYLYKLTMLDSSVRTLCGKRVNNYCTQLKSLEDVKNISLKSENDSADDFLSFKDGDSCEGEQTHTHPMDLHMALFHCCDRFAELYICRQLSTCQFALPLLVPNPRNYQLECPLWALKQIKKTWYCREPTSGAFKTEPVLKALVPVVSFIRLGSSPVSKSQIINCIISHKSHPIFFNRDMKNSTTKRTLIEGVAEIFWYCSRKQESVFDDNLAFINLHGCVREHSKQLKFIKDVSSVIVLLLQEEELDTDAKKIVNDLRKSQVPIIWLLSGVEGKKDKSRIGAKNRSKAELAEDITSRIKTSLATNVNHKELKSLESYIDNQVRQNHLVVKSKSEIQKWENKGEELFKILLSNCTDVFKLKDKHLPLQGDSWAKWCAKDKQLFRPKGKKAKNRELEKAEVINEKQKLRKEQCEMALSSHYQFMTRFLDLVLGMKPRVRYMLNWLEVALSELFDDKIYTLQNQYHTEWMKVKTYGESVKDIQGSLQTISKQINSAFGLQHIMREVAQLYEAFVSEKQRECHGLNISRLPEVGAEMVLSGYPLEIIDGDVSHIPILWVNAVVDKLIQKIGDQKVFVLSVIGPQSSGKSTLLNTMFGLQFAVSPGRCTRGASMQLLKVEEDIRNQVKFDFVLVLDTEGLGSPEISPSASRQHDNELATFVVGISHLTLINIMGENPSCIKETLQICFQAFLRMKSVKVKVSCIFVHQNASEATTKDDNKEGRRKFFEELNTISLLAAKEENQNVSGFSDIMQIDIESQVFYFKTYLEGDPPMASPNPSYSQNVQELKVKLLSIAKWQPSFNAPRLSEFKAKMNDLWNALMKEDFIFHFQNSLAVTVYNRVEKKYLEWSWKLREHALQMQTELHNLFIASSESVEKYEKHMSLYDIYKNLLEEMEKFFREDNHTDMLEQWRATFVKRLETLTEQLVLEIKVSKSKLLEHAKHMKRREHIKLEVATDLTEECKKMAADLKGKDDKKIKNEFDMLWTKWTARVSKEAPEVEQTDVQRIVEKALEENFKCFWGEIRDHAHDKEFRFQKDRHVRSGDIPPDIEKHGERLLEMIEKEISVFVTNSGADKTGVNENLIFSILRNINNILTSSVECSEFFSERFTADISAYVCFQQVNHLKELEEDFLISTDPLKHFIQQREHYFKSFKMTCDGALSVNLFVDTLMTHLQSAVKDAVTSKVTIEMANKLRSTNPALCKTKSNLVAHVMKHLATEEDFEQFIHFIMRPQNYIPTFIAHEIDTYLLDNHAMSEIFKTNLSLLKDEILAVGLSVTSCIKNSPTNASEWLNQFCLKLSRSLPITKTDLLHIEDKDISDTEHLKTRFSESLKEMGQCFSENISESDRNIIRQRTCDIIFQQFSGCWEKCPFCHAVCMNSIPNHVQDHSAQWHRCKGLGHCYIPGRWPFSSSKQFDIEFCTTAVLGSDSFRHPKTKKYYPFKEYRKAGKPYERWSIQADSEPGAYWKWFVCRFQKELEERFSCTFNGAGEIPESWKNIQKTEVLGEVEQFIEKM